MCILIFYLQTNLHLEHEHFYTVLLAKLNGEDNTKKQEESKKSVKFDIDLL